MLRNLCGQIQQKVNLVGTTFGESQNCLHLAWIQKYMFKWDINWEVFFSYITWPMLPVLPTMLAMLTMLPASFCSFIKLAAVWVTRKVPFRLTSITWLGFHDQDPSSITCSKSSSFILSRKPSLVMPAELTTISGARLYFSRICLKHSLTDSLLETSPAMAWWSSGLIKQLTLFSGNSIHANCLWAPQWMVVQRSQNKVNMIFMFFFHNPEKDSNWSNFHLSNKSVVMAFYALLIE